MSCMGVSSRVGSKSCLCSFCHGYMRMPSDSHVGAICGDSKGGGNSQPCCGI